MRRYPRSFQYQFILVITGITLLLTLILGALSLKIFNDSAMMVAKMRLNWQVHRTAEPLQYTLYYSSNILNSMAHTLEDNVPDPNALTDPSFRSNIKHHLENQFNMKAEASSSIYGFFILFNPTLIGQTDGFWYTLHPEQNQYGSHSIEEIQHFFYRADYWNAWFNQALTTKQPFWREPYISPIDGIRKIAYVVPVYSQGKLIGLMGFSIRLQLLIDNIEFTHMYDNSYAILFSDDGKLYYHPDYPDGDTSSSLDDFGLGPYARTLKGKDSNDQLLSYHYRGETRKMAFKTLHNGMNLGISTPESSLYAERDRILISIIFLIFFFSLITSIVAVLLANWIIVPLKSINAAARRIGEGNYNQLLAITHNDELGELAQNMNRTMIKMKEMVQQLKAQALEDKLTSILNSTAYEQHIMTINQRIASHDPQLAFSVLMIDVNGLKGINDQFGHAMGDELLCRTVQFIKSIYTHSPIFRIGGDEFLVLIQGEDYQNRFTLLEKIKPCNKKRNYQQERPWEQLAFAAGMSDYQPGTDTSYQDIFLRADTTMYKSKKSAEGPSIR